MAVTVTGPFLYAEHARVRANCVCPARPGRRWSTPRCSRTASRSDADTGDLFVSATSEIAWESIHLVDGPGNYGWPVREGSHSVDIETRGVIDACPDVGPHGEPLRAAVVEYPNLALGAEGVGSAVVGGTVYRGSALPDLRGRLVVADWSAGFGPPAGQLLVTARSDAAPWPLEPLWQVEAYVLSLGQDAELAAVAHVEVRRVHASHVEAYLDLRVHGMQHLVDYALVPNARGGHLLLRFVPDFRPERP